MNLFDRVSPTLKANTQNNKAFDKTLDELKKSLKGYEEMYFQHLSTLLLPISQSSEVRI